MQPSEDLVLVGLGYATASTLLRVILTFGCGSCDTADLPAEKRGASPGSWLTSELPENHKEDSSLSLASEGTHGRGTRPSFQSHLYIKMQKMDLSILSHKIALSIACSPFCEGFCCLSSKLLVETTAVTRGQEALQSPSLGTFSLADPKHMTF